MASAALPIFAVLLFASVAFADLGVDVTSVEQLNSTSLSCLVQTNQVVGIAIQGVNGIVVDTNLASAGFTTVDVMMLPCPLCTINATAQAQKFLGYLQSNSVKFSTVWIRVTTYQKWDSDTSTNLAFIQGLVEPFQAASVSVGIFSSASIWNSVTGNSTALSSLPLWYAVLDNNPSFDNFSPFGGWTTPTRKKYRLSLQDTSCGVSSAGADYLGGNNPTTSTSSSSSST